MVAVVPKGLLRPVLIRVPCRSNCSQLNVCSAVTSVKAMSLPLKATPGPPWGVRVGGGLGG